jgi:hypothetical protein
LPINREFQAIGGRVAAVLKKDLCARFLTITFSNNYLAHITILTIFATILDRSNCKTMGKKILLLFMMVWLSVGVNAHKGSCDATWWGESKTCPPDLVEELGLW